MCMKKNQKHLTDQLRSLRSGTGHGRDGHDTKIHRAELTWRYEIAPWRLMRNLYWNTIGNLPGMHNEHHQGILLDSQ